MTQRAQGGRRRPLTEAERNRQTKYSKGRRTNQPKFGYVPKGKEGDPRYATGRGMDPRHNGSMDAHVKAFEAVHPGRKRSK